MSVPLIIVAIGAFIFFGHYLSGVFERRGIPDVLGLMALGIFIGPVLHVVDASSFGVAGSLFSNLVLVLILFESGILLKMEEIRESFKDTAFITTVSFICTAVIVASLVLAFFDVSILSAIFIGTALGGTSSAVVVGLVRMVSVTPKTKTTLILESTESDIFTLAIPLGILGIMTTGEFAVNTIFSTFLSSFALALFIGICGAFAWIALLERFPTLKFTKFSTIAFLFLLYGIAEFLNFSGPLTALSFGVAIGNARFIEPRFLRIFTKNDEIVLQKEERDFFSEIVFLLRIFFFIFIGVSIQIGRLDWLVWGALITGAVFIVRLVVTRLIIEQDRPLLDKAILSVMIPKGLGSAVIATLPLQQGYIEGVAIQSIGFSIILFSTIFCAILFFLIQTGLSTPVYALFFGKK